MGTLIPNEIYAPEEIEGYRLVGWTGGDGSGAVGYCVEYYFDGDGRYLGPDCCGIEPIFDMRK